MVFVLAIFAEVATEGAVIGGEVAVATATAASEAAATAAEVAATAAETISEAAASGGEATATAAASEATAAAVDAGSAAVDAGTATATESAEGLGSAIWDNAKAFGKWVVKEVAKGALFEAGMKALEATFRIFQDSGSSAAPEMVELVTDINNAHLFLDKCTDDWLAWMNSHYDSRASYGTLTVDGTTLQYFQVFQQKLGDLGIYLRGTVAPLIGAANKNKNLTTVNALKAGMIDYANKVKAVNQAIPDMGGMMAAGLKNHTGDIMDAALYLTM